MNLSEQIKTQRKQAGLTQEQVANYLGVSAPAVHKWEKGSSYPDITLLPALARLLHLDMNQLFSFREELSEREIALFVQTLSEKTMSGEMEEAFGLAREKIREYPRCGQLLYTAACLLDAGRTLNKGAGPQPPEWEEEIHRWYEQAAESTDQQVRYSSLLMLAQQAVRTGDWEKASQFLDQIPNIPAPDKTPLESQILCLREGAGPAAEQLEGVILRTLSRLLSYLYRLMELESKDGQEEKAAQVGEIAASMVPLFGLWPYAAVVPYLLTALNRKDPEASVRLLRAAWEESQKPWRVAESPLYYRFAKGKATAGMDNVGKQFRQALLSEVESGLEEYRFLQGNPAFNALLEEVRGQSPED